MHERSPRTNGTSTSYLDVEQRLGLPRLSFSFTSILSSLHRDLDALFLQSLPLALPNQLLILRRIEFGCFLWYNLSFLVDNHLWTIILFGNRSFGELLARFDLEFGHEETVHIMFMRVKLGRVSLEPFNMYRNNVTRTRLVSDTLEWKFLPSKLLKP